MLTPPPPWRWLILQATFNHPAVYITENGFAQTGGVLMDDGERAGFYRETVGEVAKGNGQLRKGLYRALQCRIRRLSFYPLCLNRFFKLLFF